MMHKSSILGHVCAEGTLGIVVTSFTFCISMASNFLVKVAILDLKVIILFHMMLSSSSGCTIDSSGIKGSISLPIPGFFRYCVKTLNSLFKAFLTKLSPTHHLDILLAINRESLMKISNNLVNIQTMIRDNMEKFFVSFPYSGKRFIRFFRKVLDSPHECISAS